jgi:hypothetical protein
LPISRRSLALTAIVFAAGCVDKTTLAPTASLTVVHAVLDAGSMEQLVVVQTTSGAQRATSDVSGARVSIVTPNNVWVAREQKDSVALGIAANHQPVYRVNTVYHISLAAIGDSVIPGARYTLAITLPDGATVTGSTTVPDVAAIKTTGDAATPFDIDRDSITLSWPHVRGARGYEVQVHSEFGRYASFADTTITLKGTTQSSQGDDAFIPGFTNQLVVAAVDTNYFDYYRRGADPFSGATVVTHLTGAAGVFGSIVELRRVNLAVR